MVWNSENRRRYYFKNLDKFKEYSKNYRITHKHEIYLRNKQYRKVNKERMRVYNQRYREENILKITQQQKEYYEKNKIGKLENERKRGRELRKRQKAMILDHYGAVCKCCGEDNVKFLTIDHLNNDGATHRALIGGSSKVYPWIIKHNFPIDFQVLCYNCNIAKGVYGQCPHKHN